ncbi:uncharacterized protein LOC108031572 isoform X2 [Drosophila biarmipes]|uniref:uncharacterized protein LOC108031572 isoform X2 n=1 Tax=Drosophila biarmipes TaxID=125945 RepID=UPI0021CCE2A9|nr:uncharacterized protein LOC108031572 isoform X2 [Drosophila biarmipes]
MRWFCQLSATVCRIAVLNCKRMTLKSNRYWFISNSVLRDAILNYAKKNLTVEECENIITHFVNKKFYNMNVVPRVSKSFYLKMILEGEPTTGYERIEAAYLLKVHGVPSSSARARRYMVEEGTFTNRNYFSDDWEVLGDLLSINEELSSKRYTKNSKVHRKKMRVAYALIAWKSQSSYGRWSDTLWKALFCPNDLLGITIMYEVLVALLLPSIDVLLGKLKMLATLKETQQESLLSVTHIYVLQHWDNPKVEAKLEYTLTLLHSFTNNASRQTRLLGQLIVHRLATKWKETSTRLTKADEIRNTIEADLAEKLEELQSEPRLLLPQIAMCRQAETSEKLLWITNAPLDECITPFTFLNNVRDSFGAGQIISSAEI